ncbi:MAG: hypothetical protein FWC16_08200 [Defluviitaleaceae bacterium]|nr:hypothetical protein [Defluviitaleaceae bacterium]MCL2274891.1 hypothetical protein [Defluviitaleaceae bacterium]
MLKGNKDVISAYMKANSNGDIFVIPIAAYYEIKRGLFAIGATVQMQAFSQLCNTFDVVEMTLEVWEKAAEIWAKCRKSGMVLGKDDGDIFIAAQCMVNNYTLVTHNISDFERIDGLKFISWAN